jgi:hypothetical protein
LFIENATPLANQNPCFDPNRKLPGQAAKAFWDYDDATNEGPGGAAAESDVSSKQTLWMATRWDNFPNGTGDGQDFESGDDGVNMWDYWKNAAFGDSDSTRTLLNHNCLSNQDFN